MQIQYWSSGSKKGPPRDYPKHVEPPVLRLSKPVGNKVLGTLKRSAPPKEG